MVHAVTTGAYVAALPIVHGPDVVRLLVVVDGDLDNVVAATAAAAAAATSAPSSVCT